MSFHEREKGVGGQNLTSSHQKLKSKLMRIKYSQVSHRIIQPGVLLHMGRKIIMRCFFFKVFIEFVTILLLFLCYGFLAKRHVTLAP